MRKLVTASAFILMTIGAAPAVQAHEFRSFGKGYSVFLGSYVEPAFGGVENGIDIFPTYSYTAFDGSQQTYFVDTGNGDTFNFTKSEILYSNNPLTYYSYVGRHPSRDARHRHSGSPWPSLKWTPDLGPAAKLEYDRSVMIDGASHDQETQD